MSSPSARKRSSLRWITSSSAKLGRLTASPDIHAAAWILIPLRDFDHTVGSIVPPVFEAYARVFHPASRRSDEDKIPVRWAEVAMANAREMHPAAEWGSIAGSWAFQHRSTQPAIWDEPPSTGTLPGALAQRLLAILSDHTVDRDHGFFAVWEGWGVGEVMFLFREGTPEECKQRARDVAAAEVDAWRGLIDSAATFAVPHRTLHLLRGPLVAIEDF